MSISVKFVWFDMWVGLYVDVKKRTLYIGLLPMLPIVIALKTSPVSITQKMATDASAVFGKLVTVKYVEGWKRFEFSIPEKENVYALSEQWIWSGNTAIAYARLVEGIWRWQVEQFNESSNRSEADHDGA